MLHQGTRRAVGHLQTSMDGSELADQRRGLRRCGCVQVPQRCHDVTEPVDGGQQRPKSGDEDATGEQLGHHGIHRLSLGVGELGSECVNQVADPNR